MDSIQGAIDAKHVVLLVVIDFSSAFDLVNICLLLDKFKNLGFSDSACRWVESFLTDRLQWIVAPSGEISEPITRNCGVPQGTINGPPSFSLYPNDALSVLKHCEHHLYADDLTIYCRGSFKELNNIFNNVNEDFASLSSWAADNGLSINSTKTQAIWFRSRNFISRLNANVPPRPVIDRQPIDYCSEIILLEAMLDSTLSWRPHCVATCKKVYAALARLRRCSDCLLWHTKLVLVKSLVLPYFDYVPGILLSLSQEICNKLSRCMNGALRFVVRLKKSDHITPTYKNLVLLPYASRRKYLCINLLVNILRSSKPRYLYDKFSFRDMEKTSSKRLPALDLDVK